MIKRTLIVISYLFCMTFSIYSQKQYITVYNSSSNDWISLSGELPEGIKASYNKSNSNTIGNVLNMLGKKGFFVEYVTQSSWPPSTGSSYGTTIVNYLLSGNSSNQISPSGFDIVKNDGEEDVVEVARYNLQGVPVNSSEKGIQIVVYSNYTTKTIIVE